MSFPSALACGAALYAVLGATSAYAQSPPRPPERPFDLKLPPGRSITPVTPTPAQSPSAAAGTLVAAPLPPTRPEAFTLKGTGTRTASVTPQEAPPPAVAPAQPPPPTAAPAPPQQTPSLFPREWPRLLPGQQEKAEPHMSDRFLASRGLSTDPGTSTTCLPEALRSVLNQVISRFGGVHVTSTWRPAWRARRGSFHRNCEAVDFRVHGIAPREVLRFVSTLPETGGRKVYWNGLIHVDTGPVRSW
jgi:hypothetical protein